MRQWWQRLTETSFLVGQALVLHFKNGGGASRKSWVTWRQWPGLPSHTPEHELWGLGVSGFHAGSVPAAQHQACCLTSCVQSLPHLRSEHGNHCSRKASQFLILLMSQSFGLCEVLRKLTLLLKYELTLPVLLQPLGAVHCKP